MLINNENLEEVIAVSDMFEMRIYFLDTVFFIQHSLFVGLKFCTKNLDNVLLTKLNEVDEDKKTYSLQKIKYSFTKFAMQHELTPREITEFWTIISNQINNRIVLSTLDKEIPKINNKSKIKI